MGPTLNHLSHLLRLPFGCGEQNMIHFAPNVFVLKYLQKTQQLSPEVERETTDYLVQGTGGTAWEEGVGRKAEVTVLGAAHTAGAAEPIGRQWMKGATGWPDLVTVPGACCPHLLGQGSEC